MIDESLTNSDFSIFYGILNSMDKSMIELRQLSYFYADRYQDDDLEQFLDLWTLLHSRYFDLGWGNNGQLE